MLATKNIEAVVSFDTTGSMYACLAQVRRLIAEWARRLHREIHGIRLGAIAHGDYCDEGRTYITKLHPLSDDLESMVRFVQTVGPTGGGDLPECYELVLHQARSLGWMTGSTKAFVLIGDDVPHPPHDRQNTLCLDWRNELGLLIEMGIKVYAIQALGRSHATPFYREIAERTGGFHFTLDQFGSVMDIIMAVCYQQAGPEALGQWERTVEQAGRMNRDMDRTFRTLSGGSAATRPPRFAERPTTAAATGRFQVFTVPSDQSIREFVEANGLIFQRGHGFYEFMKAETVQSYKEVVLVKDGSGDVFANDVARTMIGLPIGVNTRTKPRIPDGYTAFVQSTSYNRKLIGGTRFLYEVDMTR